MSLVRSRNIPKPSSPTQLPTPKRAADARAFHKGQDNRTNMPKRDTDGSDQSYTAPYLTVTQPISTISPSTLTQTLAPERGGDRPAGGARGAGATTGGGKEEAAGRGRTGAERRGGGWLGRGAPPPAHVLGQAAPGSEADEHARERARRRAAQVAAGARS